MDRIARELPPPGPTAPAYSPYDPASPELDPQHPLYWRYGQNAGGVVLTTSRFYGQKMRDVPWSFLVECEKMGGDAEDRWLAGQPWNVKVKGKGKGKGEQQGSWELQLIFETYKKGLEAWIHENPERYTIPDGVYRGEEVRLMDSHDIEEVLSKAKFNPRWAETHSLWVLAAKEANRQRRMARRKLDMRGSWVRSVYDTDSDECF